MSSSEDILDLYDNGFRIKNNCFQLVLKGLEWKYKSWEQTEQDQITFHVLTSKNHLILILRESNYTIHIQNVSEVYVQHSLCMTTFEILKKHIFELCKK